MLTTSQDCTPRRRAAKKRAADVGSLIALHLETERKREAFFGTAEGDRQANDPDSEFNCLAEECVKLYNAVREAKATSLSEVLARLSHIERYIRVDLESPQELDGYFDPQDLNRLVKDLSRFCGPQP